MHFKALKPIEYVFSYLIKIITKKKIVLENETCQEHTLLLQKKFCKTKNKVHLKVKTTVDYNLPW